MFIKEIEIFFDREPRFLKGDELYLSIRSGKIEKLYKWENKGSNINPRWDINNNFNYSG